MQVAVWNLEINGEVKEENYYLNRWELVKSAALESTFSARLIPAND